MKKQITILLIVAGMLISAGGCGAVSLEILGMAGGALLTAEIMRRISEEHYQKECERGGAWFVESSDPNQYGIPDVVGAE